VKKITLGNPSAMQRAVLPVYFSKTILQCRFYIIIFLYTKENNKMMSVLTVAVLTAVVIIFVQQAYAQIAALPKNYKFEDYTLDKVLPKSNGSSIISTAIPIPTNMTAGIASNDVDTGTKLVQEKPVSGSDSQQSDNGSSSSSSEGEGSDSSGSSEDDGGSSSGGGDLFTNDDNDDELGDLFE
jgi:uncharacterized membrane protein YgcG